MEALEHLQSVHSHLRLLHTHAIATSHDPTNRFLAEFLLILGASGKSSVEMGRLCGVLVDAIPKMMASTLFDEMARVPTSGTSTSLQHSWKFRSLDALAGSLQGFAEYCKLRQSCVKFVPSLSLMSASVDWNCCAVSDSKLQGDSPRTQPAAADKLKIEIMTSQKRLSNPEGRRCADLKLNDCVDNQTLTTQLQRSASLEGGISNCLVSFKSMERARSTLDDFCRSYFMFHDMDVENPIHVFRHLPLLVFVESYIYQLDEQNEDQLCASALMGASKPLHDASNSVSNRLGKDSFAGLRAILHERDLLTKRIEDELMDGVRYWRLEQSLCTALSSRGEVKIEDVLQALRLKSFDYRVLNLLLYGLRNEPVDEAQFEFLSISELLVEIADDLFDYEEDVGKNSFNVLRMFLYIYGPREAPTRLAEFIGKSEVKYQKLLEELEPNIRVKYQKRCEEAVKEGGSKSVHLLGSWTIPSLITDEDAFRKQIM